MKKITVFLFAVGLCFCLLTGAARMASAYEVPVNHPIDVELAKRIAESSSAAAGAVEAYEYAAEEWNKLLNKNYNALMQRLNKEEQETLRASQREWIKYRDLEFAFNKKYWSKFSGAMYVPSPYAFKCNFVRDRALRLGYYLEDLAASQKN